MQQQNARKAAEAKETKESVHEGSAARPHVISFKGPSVAHDSTVAKEDNESVPIWKDKNELYIWH